MKGVEVKVFLLGVFECYIVDLKEEFVKEYIYLMLKIGVYYEGKYLFGIFMVCLVIVKV